MAVNIITDPSFELESWTLGGDPGPPTHAFYNTSPVRTGTKSLELWHEEGGPSNGLGHATSATIAIGNKGEPKTVGIYVQCEESHPDMELLVWHYPNGTGMPYQIIHSIESTDVEGTDWIYYETTVNPAGNDDQIHIRPNLGGGGPVLLKIVKWHIDDIIYADSSLAVKLAERAIDAVVGVLQSDLAGELTAIDTERADGITMAAPPNGNYYKRPKPEIAGGAAHVEVFEGEFGFDNPYVDSDAQRAVYDIPITIRVTWFNRDGDDRDTMVTRGRRYACGVFNVINKTPGLGDSDDATQISSIESVTPGWESVNETEPNTFKGQTTLSAVVRCEEVQA